MCSSAHLIVVCKLFYSLPQILFPKIVFWSRNGTNEGCMSVHKHCYLVMKCIKRPRYGDNFSGYRKIKKYTSLKQFKDAQKTVVISTIRASHYDPCYDKNTRLI